MTRRPRMIRARRLVRRGELVLAGAAVGAHPVIGEILEGGSGLDAVAGVPNLRVVDVAADIARVFLHHMNPPSVTPAFTEQRRTVSATASELNLERAVVLMKPT